MTSFISAAELTQMRADAARTLLDATCTLLTPTANVNGIGETTLTWGTVGVAVPCRLRPAGLQAQMVQLGGQPQTSADWQLTLPFGTVTVAPGDRVVIDSATYEVKQSIEEETWRTAVRVNLTRIEV
jgi:hypothetical protein